MVVRLSTFIPSFNFTRERERRFELLIQITENFIPKGAKFVKVINELFGAMVISMGV